MTSMRQHIDALKKQQINEGVATDVIGTVEKYLSSKLGKIYRYGGPTGYQELKGNGGRAIGFQYFMDNLFGFRINYHKSEHTGKSGYSTIDVWDRYAIDADPSYTIDLNGADITSVLDQIVSVFKQPQVAESLNEYDLEDEDGEDDSDFESGVERLEKRRQPSLGEFRTASKQLFGRYTDLTRFEVTQIKEQFNFMMPPYIFAQINDGKTPNSLGRSPGRGKFDIIPADEVAQQHGFRTWDDYKANGGKSEKETDDSGMTISVIGRMDKTGKFSLVPKNVAEVAMKEYVQDMVQSKELNAPVEERDIDTLFSHLSDLTRLVVKGAAKSLIVYGGPGTGKTFTVTSTLGKFLSKGEDWIVVKGKATPKEMYNTFFLNNGKIIVFDDTDSVFASQDATNILKAALDSSEETIVSWMSSHTKNVTAWSPAKKAKYEELVLKQELGSPEEDENEDDFYTDDDEIEMKAKSKAKKMKEEKLKIPCEFNFTGRVIFISNLAKHQMDSAVLTRSFGKIDMTLTPEESLRRIKSIMEFVIPPSGSHVSNETKIEVYNMFKTGFEKGTIKDVSLRAYTIALDVANSGMENWIDLMQYTD